MSDQYKENIEGIFALDTVKQHKSCYILTCLLHIKETKKNINLFSLCILNETQLEREKEEILEKFNISEKKYSIIFFRQNMYLENFKKFILSYNGDCFINPLDNQKLEIHNSSFINLSLLDTKAINDNYDGLIPKTTYNYLSFEYFVTNKSKFKNVDDEKVNLKKFIDNLKTAFEIDLEYFKDRLGNFIVLIPEVRLRADFMGGHSTGKFLVRISYLSNIKEEDYVVILKSEMNNVLIDHRIIQQLEEKIVVDNFNKDGVITVEIWNIKENKLAYRTSGVLLKSIILDTGIIVGRRKVKVMNKKTKELIKEDIIQLVSKDYIHSKYIKKDINSIILSREIENRKKELLISNKLIHYKCNEQEKARKDILEIINKNCDDFLLIWDPFFSEDDLVTYIVYIENVKLNIQIISDFTNDFLKKNYKDENEFRNKVQNSINELKEVGVRNIEFRYRSGNIGYPFHDRFIITNRKCWMLGSSFNSIGKSHSVIIEVEYQEIVKNEFDELWKAIESKSIV